MLRGSPISLLPWATIRDGDQFPQSFSSHSRDVLSSRKLSLSPQGADEHFRSADILVALEMGPTHPPHQCSLRACHFLAVLSHSKQLIS